MALVLHGCGPQGPAENLETPEPGAASPAYQSQYRVPPTRNEASNFLISPQLNAEPCRPFLGGDPGKGGGSAPVALQNEILSRGDLIEIHVEGDRPTLEAAGVFSGDYVVSRDGDIRLPFVGDFRAEGRSPNALASEISQSLAAREFYIDPPRVTVILSGLAVARVTVGGAVFEPQPLQLGDPGSGPVDERRQQARGASTEARNLTAALRQAGGVRPDADLSAVELRRAGRVYRLDLRPVLKGQSFQDIMLVSGDEVTVHSRLCFQDDLMVPSPISPPGINLFLSNLIEPTRGNAPAAIGREARQVPYGTRLMQGGVTTNCVGGVRATNANRAVALFSRNPITDVSFVVEREVEDMRVRKDRDDYDPYLLPGDAMACYDSAVTALSDAARVLGLVGGAIFLAGAN
ncbi:MAG: polysaccharide biosynthesis/export family protein [Pseudomonadota bacterium]